MTEEQIVEKVSETIQTIGMICERSCTTQGLLDGHAPMPEAQLDTAYLAACRAIVMVSNGLFTTKEEVHDLLAEVVSAATLLHKHCVLHRVGSFAEVLDRMDRLM